VVVGTWAEIAIIAFPRLNTEIGERCHRRTPRLPKSVSLQPDLALPGRMDQLSKEYAKPAIGVD
jgi:hypothetical protein